MLDADVVLLLDRGAAPGALRVVAAAGTKDVPHEVPVVTGSLVAAVLSHDVAGARADGRILGNGLGPALVVPVVETEVPSGLLVVARRPGRPAFGPADLDRARRLAVSDGTGEPATVPDVTGAPLLDRLFETAAGGVGLVDHDLRFRWANVPLCVMLGRPRDALVDHDATESVHPDHLERALAFYGRLRAGDVAGARERILFRRPDETPVWCEVAGSVVTGAPLFLVQQFAITAEQGIAEEHAYHAMHDDLTGLANRALLRDRLHALLARGHRVGARTVVFYLDLDKFKDVNDTYGHAAGDAVLRETAHRLGAVVRAGDTVARVGGDEFVVAGEAADVGEATQLAERIGSALRPPIEIGEEQVHVSASIGVALDGEHDTPDDVVNRADRGLLRAKRFVQLHVVPDRE